MISAKLTDGTDKRAGTWADGKNAKKKSPVISRHNQSPAVSDSSDRSDLSDKVRGKAFFDNYTGKIC